jgi:hypothetical protein
LKKQEVLLCGEVLYYDQCNGKLFRIGIDITKRYQKKKFLLPIVFFSITLLVFSLIGLGKFLDKQE